MKTPETHERFKASCAEGHRAELFAAEWLRARGHQVVVAEQRIAPTLEERHEYHGPADLRVIFATDKHQRERLVEVRVARQLTFTCAEDIRFNAKAGFKLKDVKPTRFCIAPVDGVEREGRFIYAWMILSSDWNGIGICYVKHMGMWFTVPTKEPNSGEERQSYACKLDLVEWHKVQPDPQWIKAFDAPELSAPLPRPSLGSRPAASSQPAPAVSAASAP